MIDAATFKPNSNWLLLFKCRNDHVRGDGGKVLVELTDKSLDNTQWLEVVDVGPDCKLFRREDAIGKLVKTRSNFSHYLMNYGAVFGDGYWLCRETDDAGQPVLLPFVFDI